MKLLNLRIMNITKYPEMMYSIFHIIYINNCDEIVNDMIYQRKYEIVCYKVAKNDKYNLSY